VAAAMGASGADSLPWSWKECTLLRVYEEYEFCLTLRAPRNEKSAERPSEGGFEGIENVFAAVGLSGAAQPQPARRGILSQDLFESPNGPPSRRSSGKWTWKRSGSHNPPPDALVHEKSVAEGDKNAPLENLPCPFPGLARETAANKNISCFRRRPPYRKRVQGVTMRRNR